MWVAPTAFLVAAAVAAEEGNCSELRQFTFSWQFQLDCNMGPRGGTTSGPSVTLDSQPNQGWVSLQDPGLSNFERDRRAILAMAGPYRTSFDFLEIAGYSPEFEPAAPYQSWSTEYVYLLEDSGDFISLQHVIVMFFQNGDEISGPVVMKHWRQDWQFEKSEVLAYSGNQTWQKEAVPEDGQPGSWSQAVFQVDDSPRYESWGHWDHKESFSTWESAETWRPLPRRESSVRDDYQVLEGINRHSILPNGWLHEEVNYKLALGEKDNSSSKRYLAKELGVNRYELILDHDFSKGDEYMQKTGPFWAEVRAIWNLIIAEEDGFQLRKDVEGEPMFMRLFSAAEAAASGEEYGAARTAEEIRAIIDDYMR